MSIRKGEIIMAAAIKQLKDWVYVNGVKSNEEITVYPVTRSKAVYMNDGKSTVESIIGDLMDSNSTITFANGTITETKQSGRKVTTSFNGNTITEKCVNSDNTDVYTKTTTFNGSTITTATVWKED